MIIKDWLSNEPKTTALCAVLSLVSLVLSLGGWLRNMLPIDIAWIAIILCGVPIVFGATTALINEHDIKADVLVSMALIASVATQEWFAAGEVALLVRQNTRIAVGQRHPQPRMQRQRMIVGEADALGEIQINLGVLGIGHTQQRVLAVGIDRTGKCRTQTMQKVAGSLERDARLVREPFVVDIFAAHEKRYDIPYRNVGRIATEDPEARLELLGIPSPEVPGDVEVYLSHHFCQGLPAGSEKYIMGMVRHGHGKENRYAIFLAEPAQQTVAVVSRILVEYDTAIVRFGNHMIEACGLVDVSRACPSDSFLQRG